jgi:hypothetical protein
MQLCQIFETRFMRGKMRFWPFSEQTTLTLQSVFKNLIAVKNMSVPKKRDCYATSSDVSAIDGATE